MRSNSIIILLSLGVAVFALGRMVGRKESSRADISAALRASTNSELKTNAASRAELPTALEKLAPGSFLTFDAAHHAVLDIMRLPQSDRSARISEIIERVAPQDAKALIPIAEKILQRDLKEELRNGLAGLWATVDPPGAMAYAQSLNPPSLREGVVMTVLGAWAEEDPEAAVQWANAQPASADKAQFLSTTIRALALVDPRKAMTMLPAGLRGRQEFTDIASEVFSLWAGENAVEAARQAQQLPGGPFRKNALQGIAQAWAETAPATAMAWVETFRPGQERQALQQVVLNGWARSDPRAAADYAWKTSALLRNNMLSQITAVWSQQDLPATIAWVRQLPEGENRMQAFASLAGAWAQQDPQGIKDYLAGLSPSLAAKAIHFVASAMAGADPEATWDWIMTLPAGVARDGALMSTLNQMGPIDAEAARRVMALSPAGNSSAHLMRQLAVQWAQSDPDAALEWAQALPSPKARNSAIGAIQQSRLNEDPTAVAQWLLTAPPGVADNNNLLTQTASTLANSDLDAAVAWMKKLPTDTQKVTAFNQISERWATDDPSAVARFIQSLPVSDNKNEMLRRLGGIWADNDRVAAMKFAETLPDESRASFMPSLCEKWAETDPHAAAAYLAALPGQIGKSEGALAIVDSWSAQDPKNAAAWAMSFPDETLRGDAFEKVVAAWSQQDLTAAANWVKTIHAGSARDKAVAALVSGPLSDLTPAAALQWAQTITDAESRSAQITQTATKWMEYDPAAAQAWLKKAGLETELLKLTGTPEPEEPGAPASEEPPVDANPPPANY
jgi:hypothetical protein